MRIRTIKPEFWMSESVGRLTRDARLFFIGLWSLCDDSGKTRASSRFLASLLAPYDDDAPNLVLGWLDELVKEDMVILYDANGSRYLQVRNWALHQKIDKPSQSKLPPFVASSRILANPRECSLEDQGSGIRDQGEDQGEDQGTGNRETVVPHSVIDVGVVSTAPAAPPPVSASGKPKTDRTPKLSDEDWLSKLKADVTYSGIDIETEQGKMRNWCAVNRKPPSRQRFVNWLNRIERPMQQPLLPGGNGLHSATQFRKDKGYANPK